MMTKPIRALELHYPMMQFLILQFIHDWRQDLHNTVPYSALFNNIIKHKTILWPRHALKRSEPYPAITVVPVLKETTDHRLGQMEHRFASVTVKMSKILLTTAN